MNSIGKKTFAALGAAVLVTMVGCSATPTQESTGQYLDDTAIGAAVGGVAGSVLTDGSAVGTVGGAVVGGVIGNEAGQRR